MDQQPQPRELSELLTRFTPDAGQLDRDALIFAAGQASVRPNRGWIALSALLATTQAVSLVLMLPAIVPTRPERVAACAGGGDRAETSPRRRAG